MKDHSKATGASTAPAAENNEVLEALLNVGGPGMRAALGAQLMADFQRLRTGIAVEDGAAVARAAHELKGLAATVGAERLAAMAASLDPIAETLSPVARATMAEALQREVDAILTTLATTLEGSAG